MFNITKNWKCPKNEDICKNIYLVSLNHPPPPHNSYESVALWPDITRIYYFHSCNDLFLQYTGVLEQASLLKSNIFFKFISCKALNSPIGGNASQLKSLVALYPKFLFIKHSISNISYFK